MNHNISLQIHLEYKMRAYTAVFFTFFMTSHLAIIAMKNRNFDMHIKHYLINTSYIYKIIKVLMHYDTKYFVFHKYGSLCIFMVLFDRKIHDMI